MQPFRKCLIYTGAQIGRVLNETATNQRTIFPSRHGVPVPVTGKGACPLLPGGRFLTSCGKKFTSESG